MVGTGQTDTEPKGGPPHAAGLSAPMLLVHKAFVQRAYLFLSMLFSLESSPCQASYLCGHRNARWDKLTQPQLLAL